MAGHGPRWNPHERVQAFTHPLWFLAVAAVRVVVGDPPIAATVLSFLLAMTTFWLLARRVREEADRVLLLLALALGSRAFVDFSSSGLEDPLSHLLLALLGLLLLHHRADDPLVTLRTASWPAGLLLLCRHDNLWLVAPPLAWLAWTSMRDRTGDARLAISRIARAAIPGFLPFLAWTLFSLVYYGFPFPNTAYAKLNTGVAGFELWRHGVFYLLNALTWDPLTLGVIVCGAWLWVRRGRQSGAGHAVAFGIGLHLLYVTRIGGDFMAGRFFTEPFVLALVAVILTTPRRFVRPMLAASAAFVVFWPLSPFGISDSYRSYRPEEAHGIADERAFYSGRNSYMGFDRRWPIALWRSQPSPHEHFEIGFSSYATGLDAIVLDRFALADPLLARLPAEDDWKRVGHYRRAVPAGYVESLRSGENRLVNPMVHRLYDDLRLLTQGPLFAADRLGAILRLNLSYQRPGCIDPPCRKLMTHLLPLQLYAPLLPVVDPTLGGVDKVMVEGTRVTIEGRVPFGLLAEEQLVRLLLPIHPAEDALELLPDQDPAGDLAGFRARLTFGDPNVASRVAPALCVAVAAERGSWSLLLRNDDAGDVCARLALEPPKSRLGPASSPPGAH
jgi:arabinofuranosyltransferase